MKKYRLEQKERTGLGEAGRTGQRGERVMDESVGGNVCSLSGKLRREYVFQETEYYSWDIFKIRNIRQRTGLD